VFRREGVLWLGLPPLGRVLAMMFELKVFGVYTVLESGLFDLEAKLGRECVFIS
jgi:hypothetical protein